MEWDLSQLEISSDGNPTFVIGNPMKKIHMGNNKSFVYPTSTNKKCPFLWCDYGARMHNLRGWEILLMISYPSWMVHINAMCTK